MALIIGIIGFIIVMISNIVDYQKNIKLFFTSFSIFLISLVTTYSIISLILSSYFNFNKNNDIELILMILLSMILSLILDYKIFSLYQKYNEKKFVEKYEKEIKLEKNKYYRDILKETSPAIIAYCYNRDIKNTEDIFIAILLNLQLKKYIQIEVNKIILLVDEEKLLFHEKLVIRRLDNGGWSKNFHKQFKTLLLSDMEELGYVSPKSTTEFRISSFITSIILYVMVWIFIIGLGIRLTILNLPQFEGLLFLFLIIITFYVLNLYSKFDQKFDRNIRTKKGLELREKIIGLKNFLEDFSIINNRKVDDIFLYEEYIIYAIILDFKGVLNNECNEIFEKTKYMLVKYKKN